MASPGFTGIGTSTVTLVVGSPIRVPHSIGGTSTSGTDGYWQIRCNVSSSQMRDKLAQDNFIFSKIRQTLLHYLHYFVTLSPRLGYNLDKTLLHYRKDFVTHSITIIKFVLHTFIKKNSALTHHTTNYIYLVLTLITYRYIDRNWRSMQCPD